MAVTIEEITTKAFGRSSNGYDPSEVDDFLDAVIETMESMQDELQRLQQELAVEKARPETAAASAAPQAPAADAIPGGSALDAFRSILETAVRVKNETIQKAEEQADEIREHAHDEAEKQLGSIQADKDRLNAEVDAMKASAGEVRAKLETLVKGQQELIERTKALF